MSVDLATVKRVAHLARIAVSEDEANRMMAELMTDSLKVCARDYKIAGFHFDLMGHHMREQIVDAYRAVRRIDRDTYFYGEGWEFGEDAGNARGINANQLNMAGTGINDDGQGLRIETQYGPGGLGVVSNTHIRYSEAGNESIWTVAA